MNSMGLEKLDRSIVAKIERQAKKDNKDIVFKKDWDKDCRYAITQTEDLEMSFFVIYSYRAKQFFTSSTMLNIMDEFSCDVEEAILSNRIARNTDFLNAISTDTEVGLDTTSYEYILKDMIIDSVEKTVSIWGPLQVVVTGRIL